MWFITILLGAAFSLSSWAQSGGIAPARLLSKSRSSKTVIFNVGDFAKIRVGDHGVVLKKVELAAGQGMRMVPVAKGRVISAGPNKSLWYLYSITDTSQLIMRDSYILTTEGILLEGRRRLENDRLRVVEEDAKLAQTLENRRQGDRDLLAQKAQEYPAVRKLHELAEAWDKDGVLVDVDRWVSVGKQGEFKFARELWRSPQKLDFAQRKRLETFEKMVVNYLERVNDPSFNYGSFYAAHLNREGSEEGLRSSVVSEAESFREAEARRKQKSIELAQEKLQKGEGWSADYSDEELKQLLSQTGEVYEVERRRNLTYLSYSYQAALAFGINGLDNENRADAENARRTKWGLEGIFDWFLLARDPSLQRLSVNVGLRSVVDGLSVGQNNAQTSEKSLYLGATWHLAPSPFAVSTNIPFVSLGFRTGYMDMEIPTLRERANYSFISFPVLSGGVKYNLKSGYGLRAGVSYEKLLLEQSSSNTPGGKLPSRTELLDGRLFLGMSKLF